MKLHTIEIAPGLDARITLDALDPMLALAWLGADPYALPPVAGLTLAPAAGGPVANSVGTNGAADMLVPAAAATYDVTGAGIRIGILSSSFDAQGTADLQAEEQDGDLPSTIDILSDHNGPGDTDEGRAMAEVVHAVAPGAAIDFATAYSSDQQFADGILSLAANGCNIIVDDVVDLDEPFFGDSNVIQQAVQTVIGEGISYFTSAGNSGTNFYQAAVDMVHGTLPDGSHMKLENFGATASADSGSDVLQAIVMQPGYTLDFALQWNQPFLTDGSTSDVTSGGSAFSLALYLFNGATVVASATEDVTGGDPVQVVQFDPPAAGTYDLAIALNGGTVPAGSTLEYIVFESYTTAGNLIDIEDSKAGQGGGDIIGHELLGDVNTVGAVNASTPRPRRTYTRKGPARSTATAPPACGPAPRWKASWTLWRRTPSTPAYPGSARSTAPRRRRRTRRRWRRRCCRPILNPTPAQVSAAMAATVLR